MTKTESKFKAGMYLLETLTAGMYNEPLSIYREFIQNSADSFDIIKSLGRRGPQLVKIELNPLKGTVSIYDNGTGIPAKSAEKVLSSIGSSEKSNGQHRGFRGIGRLGGLAFCEKAEFRTKHIGETVESVQEWNCNKLQRLLADEKKRGMDLRSLFKKTTNYYQVNGKETAGSFFKVTLYDVSSFRNHIMDISKILSYLESVAPLPFALDFLYADEVRSFLKKNVPNYGEYTIRLNGEKLYKPYRNRIKTSGSNWDNLNGIETFELKAGKEILAYGWYGKRNQLIGAIRSRKGVSGLRVKVGNITIGNEHLLDSCFREGRFNSYMTGEIHIVSNELIPNSRRDDFVDNEAKSRFYEAVESKVGLPMSKEIRLRSKIKSKSKPILEKPGDTKPVVRAKEPETEILIKEHTKYAKLAKPAEEILSEILNTCHGCEKLEGIRKKFGLCSVR